MIISVFYINIIIDKETALEYLIIRLFYLYIYILKG